MKLSNVLYKLYMQPWLIQSEVHRQLCAIVHDHYTGAAHAAGGRASLYDTETDPEDEEMPEVVSGVQIINVCGVISQHVGQFEKMCGGVCDIDDIIEQLDASEADTNVRSVLMVIDSPGGTVAGLPELAASVKRNTKPIVCFSDSLVASAAQWLAGSCAASYGTESSQWGCIGVYQYFMDTSRAHEMAGFKPEVFKTGKFKAAGLPGTSLTDEQRAYIQASVEEVSGWFKGAMRANRSTKDEDMEGQCFYGAAALKVGLIDAIGTKQDALAEAIALGGK